MKKEVEILITCESEEMLPFYASKEAAGADLRADLAAPIELKSGAHLMVPTGIRCEIPEGYEIQVRPRSGLAAKYGVTVLNSPGTIDADYRGTINVILINLGKENFVIEPGMRIAQIVVAPVLQARFIRAETLLATARGEGGFGHTGL